MGGRGTDVSRESSDIVLLNDDFSSLVKGIKIGRRIFDNIKKAAAYIFSIHIPIAGLALLPIILDWPLILYPVHIVFLELITDPVCSILFEAEPAEKNIMKRPPRRHGTLLDRRLLNLSLIQGFSILLMVISAFIIAGLLGRSEGQIRAFTFTSLIFANIFLVLSSRSWTQALLQSLLKKNPTVWWIMGSTLILLLLINFQPGLNSLFKFSPLPPADLALAFVLGLISIIWHEIYKLTRVSF
jgi:Ca2+-transporting ATPase